MAFNPFKSHKVKRTTLKIVLTLNGIVLLSHHFNFKPMMWIGKTIFNIPILTFGNVLAGFTILTAFWVYKGWA